ncbi:MAG TPA: M13 family metallopeptidase [Anaeromyxobacter sp.]|nr:M13 family metallopeptidase [Anaeromyxobacter sp.]
MRSSVHPLGFALAPALALASLAGACRTAPPAQVAAQAAPAEAPGIDPSILDTSVSPCTDFYQYACGGWLARTQLPPDRSIYARSFTAIEERNEQLLRTIAEADAAGARDPRDRFPDKVGDYWAACMDEAGIEARGLADLRAAWARIDAAQDAGTLAEVLGGLHRQGVEAAFALYSSQDAKDATQVIGVVAQGGLSLPDREYYLATGAKDVALQEAFRAHVARMLALAGEPQDRAAALAAAIWRLERDLASSHWTKVEGRDPKRTYHRVDRAGLERLAPRFAWGRFLAALGHPDLAAFNATTPAAIEKLDALVAATPLDAWRGYLRWRLLAVLARERALPRALVEERFAFWSKHFTGAQELTPRWKHCVDRTGTALGEALGQAFARRYHGEEGRAKARALVSAIEAAFDRRLDGLAWMDEPTRRLAREKLRRVVNKVGYPDRWRDYSKLEVDRASYFRTVLAASAFEVDRDLAKIGEPVDRLEWGMPPHEVNAYYWWGLNEMVFPAGILQPPFFVREAPDAFNYGAIGMVMGHELTHGFDDEGRQFDAHGNLRDWWTPAVAAEFDRRAACLVEQYGEYTAADDLKVNGELTLGENIADLGGVELAYAAHRAQGGGRAGPGAAGFGPDQVFFLAHAQSWCTLIRPELARYYALDDYHAPAKWRVNGPLANLPAFQEAFSCPAGSPMARTGERRCALW